MTRSVFDELVVKIAPFIPVKDETKAIHSSYSPITPKTMLAVTLRWMAGGSYLDFCLLYGVAFGTFYHETGPLWTTMRAIDAAISIGLAVNDPEVLEKATTPILKTTS